MSGVTPLRKFRDLWARGDSTISRATPQAGNRSLDVIGHRPPVGFAGFRQSLGRCRSTERRPRQLPSRRRRSAGLDDGQVRPHPDVRAGRACAGRPLHSGRRSRRTERRLVCRDSPPQCLWCRRRLLSWGRMTETPMPVGVDPAGKWIEPADERPAWLAQADAASVPSQTRHRGSKRFYARRDRVQSDSFLLTQEFLGMMLGVRRTSVTHAARELAWPRPLLWK